MIGFIKNIGTRSASNLALLSTYTRLLPAKKQRLFEQIFSEDRSELHLEYSFYHDRGIKTLTSQDIIGLNGPAYKKAAIKHGCSLKLLFKGPAGQTMSSRACQQVKGHMGRKMR
jgi:hypothetical protein